MIPMLLLFVGLTNNVVKNIDFDMNSLMIQQNGEYAQIRLPHCELSDEVGAPEVPVQSVRFVLPYGAQVTGVHILTKIGKEVAGKFLLSYVQPPVILSQTAVRQVTQPNPEIYLSDEPYPKNIIEYRGTGFFENHQICELLFYPVQYFPQSQKLLFYPSITVAVSYEGGVDRGTQGELLKKIVVNPEDVVIGGDGRDNGYFDYVIITNPPIDTVFQRLADWKTKKGIKTELKTVDWILTYYTGEDNAAKIRNYIKTLADSSVEYVLLAGDSDVVPFRFAFAMDCEYGGHPRENDLPCDLYYADLQGTWNFDNDGLYGEIEDSIDLYPDLMVGRAPVNTITEAQKFVEKVLIYEKNPELEYLNNALFAGDVMWNNPYTDGGIHKNMIEQESFPPHFEITKLYHSQGNLSPASVMNAMKQGQGLINHDGHGWIEVMSAGTGYLRNTDFDTLTNAPKYGIWISCGCWTTAFDFDAIAEHFVNSPNGGGVAFMGNSSYGWGSPGNPGFGISDRFDSRFFYSLLKEDNFQLGTALSLAKAYFIPYSREKNVYRWHQYQLNLLGDPEMPVWTAIPETLIVSHPQSLSLGSSHVLITVKDKTNNMPIKHALVCLMKGEESYASGYTDVSGSVFLNATPSTLGDCDLTVTAHNCLPFETIIPVVSGSYVSYCGWELNDSLGNDDGIANPDEDIFLSIVVKNTGDTTAYNIELILRSQDSNVTIEDSSESLLFLNVNDSVLMHNAFSMTIGSASNAHPIEFELEITDDARVLTHSPILIVGTPVVNVDEVIIAQPPTMPDEIETLYVNLKNVGLGFGHATYAQITSSDPYVSILTDSAWYGEIYPESLGVGSQPFVVSIDQSCPPSYLATVPMVINTNDFSFGDTINLLIGETGFHDDIESGSGLWTSGGTNNLWHISTNRSFSPSHSWYCGDTSYQYHNNMNCYIQSIPFMLQANSVLRFCRWLDVPIYGSDGIYVIVMGDTFADTLDFIGSGGALEDRGIQSNWFEEKYPLSEYPAGETIQVRISFISDGDGDVGEGFYIDDVHIEHVTAIEEYSFSGINNILFEVYPNPFFNRADIRLQLSNLSEKTSLKIFDVTGRLVKDLSPLLSDIGHQPSVIVWDRIDELKRKVPAGIYFMRLETDDAKITKKVILLR